MTPNSNLNILPFYESTSEWAQNQAKAFGEKYKLIAADRRIPAFQIYIKDKLSGYFSQASFKLYTEDEDLVVDVTSLMSDRGLTSLDKGDDVVVAYPDLAQINLATPQGRYYLKLDWPDSGQEGDRAVELYSEVFTINRSVSDKLKLRYSSLSDIQCNDTILDFTEVTPRFYFTAYLDTELNVPEYPFTEEGVDRDGFFFTEKQISEKTFKFNILAPEFMCDVLRIVRMMEDVTIEYAGKTYQVERFLPTVEWQPGGFWAEIAVEFQCDTVVKKIGSVAPIGTGAFNNDYSDDYSGQE